MENEKQSELEITKQQLKPNVGDIVQTLNTSALDAVTENLLQLILKKDSKQIDLGEIIALQKNNEHKINAIIQEIEKKEFNMDKYISEKFIGANTSTTISDETLKRYFWKFIDYIYYLQIQNNKDKKKFIMPSKEAFEYKVNNDVSKSKNPHYNADILLMENQNQ